MAFCQNTTLTISQDILLRCHVIAKIVCPFLSVESTYTVVLGIYNCFKQQRNIKIVKYFQTEVE